MRRQSSQRGFTLIEMMVVVVIIALLSAFVISVKPGTYGANSQNTAQEVANLFNNCKMRAVSTRRWHRCEVTPTTFTMSQWSATGMTTPAGICAPPATNCWQTITQVTFDKNVIAFAASATPYGTATSGTSSTPTAVLYDMDFKPDGSSVGGTIFFADPQVVKPWRTIVYKATGGSYARAGW